MLRIGPAIQRQTDRQTDKARAAADLTQVQLAEALGC